MLSLVYLFVTATMLLHVYPHAAIWGYWSELCSARQPGLSTHVMQCTGDQC
jgi:hypothetical protein